MQLADALSRCLTRASQEIKLDMRVDYIAFTKPWIEKLKDSTQRDPILATVYQLTQQGWPHQRRHVPHLARRYWDFRDEQEEDSKKGHLIYLTRKGSFQVILYKMIRFLSGKLKKHTKLAKIVKISKNKHFC